jgi:hypothetical protein
MEWWIRGKNTHVSSNKHEPRRKNNKIVKDFITNVSMFSYNDIKFGVFIIFLGLPFSQIVFL